MLKETQAKEDSAPVVMPIANMEEHVEKMMEYEDHDSDFNNTMLTTLSLPKEDLTSADFYNDPNAALGIPPSAVPGPSKSKLLQIDSH